MTTQLKPILEAAENAISVEHSVVKSAAATSKSVANARREALLAASVAASAAAMLAGTRADTPVLRRAFSNGLLASNVDIVRAAALALWRRAARCAIAQPNDPPAADAAQLRMDLQRELLEAVSVPWPDTKASILAVRGGSGVRASPHTAFHSVTQRYVSMCCAAQCTCQRLTTRWTRFWVAFQRKRTHVLYSHRQQLRRPVSLLARQVTVQESRRGGEGHPHNLAMVLCRNWCYPLTRHTVRRHHH